MQFQIRSFAAFPAGEVVWQVHAISLSICVYLGPFHAGAVNQGLCLPSFGYNMF